MIIKDFLIIECSQDFKVSLRIYYGSEKMRPLIKILYPYKWVLCVIIKINKIHSQC